MVNTAILETSDQACKEKRESGFVTIDRTFSFKQELVNSLTGALYQNPDQSDDVYKKCHYRQKSRFLSADQGRNAADKARNKNDDD